MIYGYIRISTDKQTVKNQRFEIIFLRGLGVLKVAGRCGVSACESTSCAAEGVVAFAHYI